MLPSCEDVARAAHVTSRANRCLLREKRVVWRLHRFIRRLHLGSRDQRAAPLEGEASRPLMAGLRPSSWAVATSPADYTSD